MDQLISLTLLRSLTLAGGIASTVLGLLLLFFPDFLNTTNKKISGAWWTGPSIFSCTVTKPFIWKKTTLSGALLLLVGIPLFGVFFIG